MSTNRPRIHKWLKCKRNSFDLRPSQEINSNSKLHQRDWNLSKPLAQLNSKETFFQNILDTFVPQQKRLIVARRILLTGEILKRDFSI